MCEICKKYRCDAMCPNKYGAEPLPKRRRKNNTVLNFYIIKQSDNCHCGGRYLESATMIRKNITEIRNEEGEGIYDERVVGRKDKRDGGLS